MNLLKIMLFLCCLGVSASACTAGKAAQHTSVETDAFVRIFPARAVEEPKAIYVFLDGTANDGNSNTNVWRLYQLISERGDPHATGMYIAGVGTAEDPLNARTLGTAESVIELALGKNMQARILAGYEFIAKQYTPADRVFIFWFQSWSAPGSRTRRSGLVCGRACTVGSGAPSFED